MDRGSDEVNVNYSSGDEHLLLPCKIRRNYACKLCNFASHNPRHFLYHQRDEHGQRGSIHECPFCVYASSHTHKLLRHIKLVHSSLPDSAAAVLAVGADSPDHCVQHFAASQVVATPPRPPPVVLTIPKRPPPPYMVATSTTTAASQSRFLSGSSLARLAGGSGLPRDLEVILVGNGSNGNELQRQPNKQTPPLSLIRLPTRAPPPTLHGDNRPSVVLFPVSTPAVGINSPPTQSTSTSRNIASRPQAYYSLLRNGSSSGSDGGIRNVLRPSPSQQLQQQSAASASTRPQLQPTIAPVAARQRRTSAPGKRKVVDEFSCSVCQFKSRSRVLVQRHEKVSHLKKKFFRCLKCSYVTNVRARYTKHVRYHSMPYIRCEYCDFSTPYKWNLDRHRRNHLEEGGGTNADEQGGAAGGVGPNVETHRCDRCSFACHSKQSLSVHLMHHHTEGGASGRRPRRMEEPQRARSPRPATVTSPSYEEAGVGGSDYRMAMEPEEMEDEEEYGNLVIAEEDSSNERRLEEAEMQLEDPLGGYRLPQPYACAECGETFVTVALLDRHAYEFHEVSQPRSAPDRSRRIAAPASTATTGSLLRCDLCPYEAKWISEVIRHRRVHIYEKPYQCQHCDFRSRWKGDMTRHAQKYHGGEKTSHKPSTCAPALLANSPPKVASPLYIEQLLDQSMSVGGENELSLYVDSEQSVTSPEQDCPLDLSRPATVPRLTVRRAPSAAHVSLMSVSDARAPPTMELLPMLLRMPPKQSAISVLQHHQLPAINVSTPATVTVTAITTASSGPPPSDTVAATSHAEQPPTFTTAASPSAFTASSPAKEVATPVVAPEPTVAPSTIRKSYQCPHCSFSSNTASRFHMHMVVHLNQKPFMCSECGYRSNWQWDITKHAKMKGSRDPAHLAASVVLVNDTGARNYEKYDQYVVYETVKPKPAGRIKKAGPGSQISSKLIRIPRPIQKKISYKCKYCKFRHNQRRAIVRHMEVHTGNKPYWCGICGQSSNGHAVILRHCRVRHGVAGPIMQRDADPNNPLPTYNPTGPDAGFETEEEEEEPEVPTPAPLPEVQVGHEEVVTPAAREEATMELENNSTEEVVNPPAAAIIDNDVAVEQAPVIDKCNVDVPSTKCTPSVEKEEGQLHRCEICPYQCHKMFDLRIHAAFHKPHDKAVFKCAFCPYFVSQKSSWIQHMRLHVDQPSELDGQYIDGTAPVEESTGSTGELPNAKPMPPPLPAQPAPTTRVSTLPPLPHKRYTCEHCPYTTDSHTTILYHRQFHRSNPLAVHRCHLCSYAVTRSHLLNQHLKVHGLVLEPSYLPIDGETPAAGTEASAVVDESLLSSSADKAVAVVPRVWVHRDGVFSKMFRCRHCPHVSKKRSVIMEHEKMHFQRQPIEGRSTYRCPLCNYSCRNAGILTTHMKVHSHEVGVQPYAGTDQEHVESTLSSQGQRDSPMAPNSSSPLDSFRDGPAWDGPEEETATRRCFLKVSSAKPNTVYRPCGRCPAKFYKPDQLASHRSHHGARLPFGCRSCDFSSPDRKHWRRHVRVHTLDYEQGFREVEPPVTFTGKKNEPPHSSVVATPEVVKLSPPLEEELQEVSLSVTDGAVKKTDVGIKPHRCGMCPASFIKYTSLVYHVSLHGGNNKFKCRHCSYSVTNIGNLVRHTKVHSSGGTVRLPQAKVVQTPVLSISAVDREQHYLRCPKCPTFFTKAKVMHFKKHVSLHGSCLQFACRRCDYATSSATSLNRHRHVHDKARETEGRMPPPPAPPPPRGDKASTTAAADRSPLRAGGRPGRQTTLPKLDDTTAVERQQMMLERLRSMSAASTQGASQIGPSGSAALDSKKVYCCERCPYVHPRKAAVQSHMRRHRVAGAGPETTCPHCDYSSTMQSFLREHVRLHLGPPLEPRHGTPEGSVAWDTMEIWARHGEERTLVYRYPNTDGDGDHDMVDAPTTEVVADHSDDQADVKVGMVLTGTTIDEKSSEARNVSLSLEKQIRLESSLPEEEQKTVAAVSILPLSVAAAAFVQPVSDSTASALSLSEVNKDPGVSPSGAHGAIVHDKVAELCADLVNTVSKKEQDGAASSSAADAIGASFHSPVEVHNVVHSLLDSVQLVCEDKDQELAESGQSFKPAKCKPIEESVAVGTSSTVSGVRSLQGDKTLPKHKTPLYSEPTITKEELLGQLSLVPMIPKPNRSSSSEPGAPSLMFGGRYDSGSTPASNGVSPRDATAVDLNSVGDLPAGVNGTITMENLLSMDQNNMPVQCTSERRLEPNGRCTDSHAESTTNEEAIDAGAA